MNIAILGYDTEGKSSFDYFAGQGHRLEIRDQNPDIQVPEGASAVLGEAYLDNLDQFELIVRTAGLPPQKILDKNPGVAPKITSQINEFFAASPTKNIIGVTGTKGKGTTSMLITKMLQATGQDTYLGGNFGVPPLTFVDKLTADSWVVLELSSYQLSDSRFSPHIGVCLMIAAEHLNWHGTMEAYRAAKANLFAHQTPEDIAIYYAENEQSQQIANQGQGQKLPYFAAPGAVIQAGNVVIGDTVICPVDDIKLLGTHNLQNVCAAVTAVWQISQDVAAIRSVLTSFAGLPHRLELVRELDDVRYYNDSYSSVLQATEAAMQTLPGRKIVIVGGFDRMLDIDHFGSFVAGRSDIGQLLLIGNSAERVAQVLQTAGFTAFTHDTSLTTLPAMVHKARELAQPGDAVILSPGFPSFDMFKNFTDRGEQFKQAVNSL